MRVLKSALLYTALAMLANSAVADTADLEALKSGDMEKLVVHAAPKPVTDQTFTAEDGSDMTLAAYAGEVTVLNFWATWCAPCRAEMPHLAALQAGLGAGDDVEVVTIATGRNSPRAMQQFFADVAVDNLPLHTDPKQALAREMEVLGLPVTIIIDREGREVARLMGEADWNSDSAQSILTAIAAR